MLTKAAGQTKSQLERLVAELAPRPDVPESIRRLPSKAALKPELNLERAGDASKSLSLESKIDSLDRPSLDRPSLITSLDSPSHQAPKKKVVSVVQPLTCRTRDD